MDKMESVLSNFDKHSSGDRMLKAMLSLMQEGIPYGKLTVTAICSRAGLSRKTFYKFFGSTDDLVVFLAQDFVIANHMAEDKPGVFHFFNFWYHLQDWLTVLIDNGLLKRVLELSLNYDDELLNRREFETPENSSAVEKKLIFRFAIAGFVSLLEWWKEQNFHQTPEYMAELSKSILYGLSEGRE